MIAPLREELQKKGAANQDWGKVPQVKPAVTWLFLTDDGRLFVKANSPDAMHRYDIYERDARYAGTVATSLKILRWVNLWFAETSFGPLLLTSWMSLMWCARESYRFDDAQGFIPWLQLCAGDCRGSVRQWVRFATAMSGAYRVLALEPRACGESEWAGDYSWQWPRAGRHFMPRSIQQSSTVSFSSTMMSSR
ncbi:MAG: hypothetical protein ACT4O1_06570, partial [Gemmatimonadota bacterium]